MCAPNAEIRAYHTQDEGHEPLPHEYEEDEGEEEEEGAGPGVGYPGHGYNEDVTPPGWWEWKVEMQKEYNQEHGIHDGGDGNDEEEEEEGEEEDGDRRGRGRQHNRRGVE